MAQSLDENGQTKVREIITEFCGIRGDQIANSVSDRINNDFIVFKKEIICEFNDKLVENRMQLSDVFNKYLDKLRIERDELKSIAEICVHEVVNGTLLDMNKQLENISNSIEYKTIWGVFWKSMNKKPIKTMLVLFVSFILILFTLLNTFHIVEMWKYDEIAEVFKNFLKLF